MPHAPTPPALARRAWLGVAWLALCATALPAQAAPQAPSVTLEQARAALESGRAIVFDIREPAEHARGVAPGTRLLPMSQLGQRLAEIPRDGTRPVYLMCNTQNRSRSTWQALQERGGYGHVQFVEGGMSEWTRRGWPLVAPAR